MTDVQTLNTEKVGVKTDRSNAAEALAGGTTPVRSASRTLRVGLIGASADAGWARVSHVPAIKALAGLELAAVATRDQKSADAAAKAYGVPAAFADGLAMARHPDIDVVSVVVRAPAHLDYVMAALEAGKHVYCEWPLGRNTAEAEMMAKAAGMAKVRTAVGLQARGLPALGQARHLLADGAIGRILSARVFSATMAWGPASPEAMRYAEDPENGVDLVTIQGAHTLDLASVVLGELADVSALFTTQFAQLRIGDHGETLARATPDHLLVQARLREGAPLNVEVAGGRPPETPFHFEITGDAGVLTVNGGAPRGVQSGRLTVSLNGERLPLHEGESVGMPDEAAGVAGIYAQLRDDILSGSASAPDFEDALRLARLVDDLTLSSREGRRIQVVDGPRFR
jgi:predicted dehydrogenase